MKIDDASMMCLFYDNIVFDLQKSGGVSVVWYELLRRMVRDNSFNIRYIDNGGVINPYRRKLNIRDDAVIRIDGYIPVYRYLPVRIKNKTPFIFHSSYYRYCNNPNAVIIYSKTTTATASVFWHNITPPFYIKVKYNYMEN